MAAPVAAGAAVLAAFKIRTLIKIVAWLLSLSLLAGLALTAGVVVMMSGATASAYEDAQAEAEQDAEPAYPNGQFPDEALCELSWASVLLDCNAADAFELVNAAFKEKFDANIGVGYGYRTLETQEAIFRSRYTYSSDMADSGPFWDVQYWQGLRYVRTSGASAAVPGTSNHGWGKAADLKGAVARFGTAEHVWLVNNGPEYDWEHPEWAKEGTALSEPWHFEYTGASARVIVSGAEGSQAGVAIAKAARKALGLPYVWGGGNTSGSTGGGFDCSGLVQYAVFQGAGVSLPRTAATQGGAGDLVVEGLGSKIDLDLMQPGDAIAFNLNNRVGYGATDFDHIGVYVGDGVMIHAPRPGAVVHEVDMSTSSYYLAKRWNVRRYA